MNPKLSILKTEDGSFTLKREDLNETYHSLDGAIGESQHVYIDHGLEKVAKGKKKVRVFEFGFGTGINAWLTFKYAIKQGLVVEYHTVESFPVPIEVMKEALLKDFEQNEKELLLKFHDLPWNEQNLIDGGSSFKKSHSRIEDLDLMGITNTMDCIYYDAFAPSRQADAWKYSNLEKCHSILVKGGILITYCAQGAFRRDLKNLGFEIIELPGFGKKREITQAVKV